MIITLTLNGEKRTLDVAPHERLLRGLRRSLGTNTAKADAMRSCSMANW